MSRKFTAHDHYLLKCVISPDMTTLATTSADNTIKTWNLPLSEELNSGNDKGEDRALPLEKRLAQHQRWVWDAVFSADSSYLVSASSDQSAKLWDLRSGDAIRNYIGHNLAVTCVALNDNNYE